MPFGDQESKVTRNFCGALVVTSAMLRRLINCRIVSIIIRPIIIIRPPDIVCRGLRVYKGFFFYYFLSFFLFLAT